MPRDRIQWFDAFSTRRDTWLDRVVLHPCARFENHALSGRYRGMITPFCPILDAPGDGNPTGPSGRYHRMSMMRTLLVAFLMVALLPWGALLRAMPGHAGDSASAQQVERAASKTETAQMSSIRCRKGLPGSPCSPEVKALVSLSESIRPEATHLMPVRRHDRLPTGLAAPPALPPPRLG